MKVAKKKKYISLPPELKRQIAADLGCCVEVVDNALNYKTEGDRPEEIRRIAKEMGGVDGIKIRWVTVH